MNVRTMLCLTAFAVAACAPARKFQDLSTGEKVDFGTCLSEYVANSKVFENKSGTAGGAIDAITELPKRIEKLRRDSIVHCASKMDVDPRTVPGFSAQ